MMRRRTLAVEPQISTLSNGLRVVTTSVPTAQSVSVNVFVGIGSRGETRKTNGASHYMEHMLFKGTTRRPDSIMIAEAIEGAGGVLNAYTSKELTCYWNQVPFDKLEQAMDVLADMYQESVLDEEEIARERTVVQQEIRRAFDQPGAWAGELLSRATFGDQPIGWPIAGTLETVEAMGREDFVGHVATYYVPSNTVLSVAGNTTHDEVLRYAERFFGGMRDQTIPSIPPAVESFADESVIVEKREIAQCNMAMALYALPRKDPDRYPLMILNTILGRGMSSRLFKEVRERRGLAYSVGSGVSRFSDIGTMSISAGVTLENLQEATRVIRGELFKIRDETVRDEELLKARDFSTGNFRLGLESTMALAQRAGESLLMTGEIEPVDDVVASLAAVTPADVQRVAQRLFRPGAFAMAVVGPGGDAEALSAILDAA
jgi:predicted Zn-dependent peptidase